MTTPPKTPPLPVPLTLDELHDLTPSPENRAPTPFEIMRRIHKLEGIVKRAIKEIETLKSENEDIKKNYSFHQEELIEHEDRLDGHDKHFEDMKSLIVAHQSDTRALIISNQTTNGLILQSIDRSMKTLIEEVHAASTRAAAAVPIPLTTPSLQEVTTITPIP